MTSVSLATRKGRAAATSGDLVCGLASPAPPQPFVGELGDPAAEAASAIVDPLTRAAGLGLSRPPIVRVDGNLLATLAMRAAPIGGDPNAPVGTATTMVGSMLARVAGRPIARQADPAQVSPVSAIAILGGRQSVVQIAGGSVPDAPHVAALGAGGLPAIPGRTDFGATSAVQRMLSRCSPARWADLVPREHAVLVGDPVDVATGAVVTDAVDFEAVTPRVTFRRRYASNHCDRIGPFGCGWAHNYECAIWLEPGRVVLREDDGREIEFDALELPGGVARAGDVLTDAAGRLQLFCRGHFRWELRDRGRIRQFGPIAGESAKERDRGVARLVRIVREHELTVELAYDDEARLHEVRVGERSFFVLEYDEHGRIRALWTPIGERLHRHASFGYSAEHDLVDATDATGGVREYEYVQHMLVRESDPAGAAFHYGYDGFGPGAKCVRTWGTGGRLDRVLAYEGPTTLVTDCVGNVTTYRSDPLGLVRSVTDPLGDTTRYRYDDALRLVQVVKPDGTSVSDTYDAHGNLVQRKGPGRATWRMRYDEGDRCVEAIDCEGGRWHYGYDGGGRLARVEDPLGHVVRIEYENGRLARIVDPLGRATEISADAEQRALAIAVPGRAPTRFDYDELGRLASVTAATNDRIVWSYDACNRPVAVETHDESVRFDRDAAGRIVAVHRPWGTTSIRRDTFGTIEAIEAGGVAMTCAHDAEGRLTVVRRDGALVFSAQYDPRGLVTVFERSEGEPCLLLRKFHTHLVECIVEPHGTTRIEWDDAGRIIAVEGHDGEVRRFEYRADGLLSSATDERITCAFERNARGAVVRQCVGETVIDAGSVDHAGRRHGIDIDDSLHLSYLRDGDGELDRIAVVNCSVHEIRIDRAIGRAERIVCERSVVETHRDAWGRVLAGPRALRAGTPTPGPTDPLLRPRFDGAGHPLVWDEDRLLLAGAAVHVSDPDSGATVAIVQGERVELAEAYIDATATGEQPWTSAGTDPFGIDAVCPTPFGVLEHRFAYRAWNPDIRPLRGASAWNPDAWTCRVDGPALVDGRIDRCALFRLLAGPFPRDPLRLAQP
jgi:YD repeat-containing protein